MVHPPEAVRLREAVARQGTYAESFTANAVGLLGSTYPTNLPFVVFWDALAAMVAGADAQRPVLSVRSQPLYTAGPRRNLGNTGYSQVEPQMLTTDDVKRFHRLGYCITPVLFDAQQVEQIRNAFERVYANDLDPGLSWPFIGPVIGDGPYSVSTALFSAHVNRTIRATVGHQDLVRMAAKLLGCEAVRLWQDQAIRKPGTGSVAVDDGNIGFHQDYSYWQDSSTTNMVSANIALQDVTLETGALRVFPGSHKLGLLGDYSGFFNTDLNALKKQLQSDYGLGEDVPLELKAGQATFHHSLTVHGSGPNTGPSPRLVLAPAYTPDGTFFRDEGQPPCPHSNFLGDDRRHGTPYTGERFPLLCGNTPR